MALADNRIHFTCQLMHWRGEIVVNPSKLREHFTERKLDMWKGSHHLSDAVSEYSIISLSGNSWIAEAAGPISCLSWPNIPREFFQKLSTW